MRINREQFNKWIKALRSGKYKQTTDTLQDKDGYCCLGVACKVLIPKSKLQLDSYGYITGGLPDNQEYSPQWLNDINQNFFEKTNSKLSHLNDEEQLSFKEIADLLVETYPERKRR